MSEFNIIYSNLVVSALPLSARHLCFEYHSASDWVTTFDVLYKNLHHFFSTCSALILQSCSSLSLDSQLLSFFTDQFSCIFIWFFVWLFCPAQSSMSVCHSCCLILHTSCMWWLFDCTAATSLLQSSSATYISSWNENLILHKLHITFLNLILAVTFDEAQIILVYKFRRSSCLYISDCFFHLMSLYLSLSIRASLIYCALLSNAWSWLCCWMRIWFRQRSSHFFSLNVEELTDTTLCQHSKKEKLMTASLIMQYHQSRKYLIATAVIYVLLCKTSLHIRNALSSSARNQKREVLHINCVESVWPHLEILTLINYQITNQEFLVCNRMWLLRNIMIP